MSGTGSNRMRRLMTEGARPGWRKPISAWWRWIGAFTALAVVTVGMVLVRPYLGEAHVALLFLLVVLFASSAGGRVLGLAIAGAAFITFNFFFLPPYSKLTIANPLDWLVLVTFLITSVVAAQLLYRANTEAEEARQRAEEIDRLATLGAETLNAPNAQDGLRAMVDVIRATLQVAECEVFEGREDIARLMPSESADSQAPESTEVAVPLRVRGVPVGVLRVANPAGLTLTPERRRLLDALAYYAALGVERVRLTAAAEHAEAERRVEALRNALLTSVSHDLRTPLTSIKGIAHEIAEGADPSAASDIELEVDRLNVLIGDMLELSRIQAGAVRPGTEVETVDDLLGAALRQARSILRDRLVIVDVDELLTGHFGFTESLRVMVNLIENAAKYSPPGEPITIRARRDGVWLSLEVQDRGPGVPEAERDRIFEPFYRPRGTPSDVGGTGLGLSIARGLAEAQGGRLRHEPREGGGSSFVFDVPAADDTEPSPVAD